MNDQQLKDAKLKVCLKAIADGKRAIGDHNAPHDCYATGPLTGNATEDLVECPACRFLAVADRALAMPTKVEAPSKPYLPLPEEGLVVLPENALWPKDNFVGWALDPELEGDIWEYGEFGGISGMLYAVPRDSEVARLNWEAILNAELAELGLPPCPPVPDGFARWEYRGKGWKNLSAKYACWRDNGYGWTVAGYRGCAGYSDMHYLEAVTDGPTSPSALLEQCRKARAVPPSDTFRCKSDVSDRQPTERQKMAKEIYCALLHSRPKKGTPTAQLVDAAYEALNLILRKDQQS